MPPVIRWASPAMPMRHHLVIACRQTEGKTDEARIDPEKIIFYNQSAVFFGMGN
jgi:hypothetical protein